MVLFFITIIIIIIITIVIIRLTAQIFCAVCTHQQKLPSTIAHALQKSLPVARVRTNSPESTRQKTREKKNNWSLPPLKNKGKAAWTKPYIVRRGEKRPFCWPTPDRRYAREEVGDVEQNAVSFFSLWMAYWSTSNFMLRTRWLADGKETKHRQQQWQYPWVFFCRRMFFMWWTLKLVLFSTSLSDGKDTNNNI